jgi:hypothetical protein
MSTKSLNSGDNEANHRERIKERNMEGRKQKMKVRMNVETKAV